jgi:hypothetical protein
MGPARRPGAQEPRSPGAQEPWRPGGLAAWASTQQLTGAEPRAQQLTGAYAPVQQLTSMPSSTGKAIVTYPLAGSRTYAR